MTVEAANKELLAAAHDGQLDRVKAAHASGADINHLSESIGLSALHLAIGRSHLDIVKYLVETAGAEFKPDRFGRWPTVIAAQCRSSAEICDYVVEREAAYQRSQDQHRKDAALSQAFENVEQKQQRSTQRGRDKGERDREH